MTTKRPSIADAPEPSDPDIRMLAGLEVELQAIATNQESNRAELRKITAEAVELARMINALEKGLEFTDDRLRRARDAVADRLSSVRKDRP